ncbi:MAG: FeoB-associated Cys-rich membrane protein [Oscillospiraceae bacterium]|nr:FeoB-associated Cys-rich membrane protein [Oscillospiraceae bacterium]
MLNWLQHNLGSVIVALVLMIVVALAVWKLVRDRKAGKHSCGGDCAGCAMRGSCRADDQPSSPRR